MIGVALKGLAGRKVRALLTALAVVIGVSMVSGTFVLTDTMQKAFDGHLRRVVRPRPTPSSRQGDRQGLHQRQPRTVPAVAAREGPGAARGRRAAGGTIAPDAVQRGRDPRPRRQGGRLRRRAQFGLGNDAAQPQFSPLKLKTGQWPAGPRQVVDRRRHRRSKQHFKRRRHRRRVDARARSTATSVTGIATFGDVDSLGGATIAVWDLPTAQTLLDKRGPLRRRSRSPPRTAPRPPSSCAPSSRSSPASLAGQGQRGAGRGGRQGAPTSVMAFIRYFLLGLRRRSRCSSARS